MANFLLCSTCLLCSMHDYVGRWRGCMQCGQSIVCYCACFVGTPVGVLHAGCLNYNYPRRDVSSCCFLLCLSTIYIGPTF